MKFIRLILGLLVSLFLLTVLVESIEFLIVYIVSGVSMEELQTNQETYFAVRNQKWILVTKVVYSFLASFSASYLGTMITKYLKKIFFIVLSALQVAIFLYAMFFSPFKNTLPLLYWILLLVVILFGIQLSSKISKKDLIGGN